MKMKTGMAWVITLLIPACLISGCSIVPASSSNVPSDLSGLALPAPDTTGNVSLEKTLEGRRSIREYSDAALNLSQVSQLLWATQGRTAEWGGRTAPSAGGLYALDLYLVSGNVQLLDPGIYQYRPDKHDLVEIVKGDQRPALAAAALSQPCVKEAAVNLVIAAVYQRISGRYGERGVRYAHLEAGHAAQNTLLQATALGLGAVPVGAFEDEPVQKVCRMQKEQVPLYIIPVGQKE